MAIIQSFTNVLVGLNEYGVKELSVSDKNSIAHILDYN